MKTKAKVCFKQVPIYYPGLAILFHVLIMSLYIKLKEIEDLRALADDSDADMKAEAVTEIK